MSSGNRARPRLRNTFFEFCWSEYVWGFMPCEKFLGLIPLWDTLSHVIWYVGNSYLLLTLCVAWGLNYCYTGPQPPFQLHNLVCHPTHHKAKGFGELTPPWNREFILQSKVCQQGDTPHHTFSKELLWLITLTVHVNLTMRSCLILRLVSPSRIAWDFTPDCWLHPWSCWLWKAQLDQLHREA